MGGERMVLRSVYLPESLDEKLRSAAFLARRSKGDLIREFVTRGLKCFQAGRGVAEVAREETDPFAASLAEAPGMPFAVDTGVSIDDDRRGNDRREEEEDVNTRAGRAIEG